MVIADSNGTAEPVFKAILENAIRICEAKFGNAIRFTEKGELLFVASNIGCVCRIGNGLPVPELRSQTNPGSSKTSNKLIALRRDEKRNGSRAVDFEASA